MEWKNKVVLLTGASSGIGEGLALAMAHKGAIIGLAARRQELLSELAKKCEAAGGAAPIFPLDVVDSEKLAEAAKSLEDEFGKIDLMIANAGIGGNNSETRNLQAEAVAKVININLLGAVNAVAAVLPGMIARRSGHLVAISSLAGFRGLPKSAAYSASKAGLNAFFESVRLDVQQHNIKVTIIQPGFIKTPLTSGRDNKMPFLMELDDAIPHFMRAIEGEKKFAAFPLPLALLVKAGRFFPASFYDRIASRARYRE